MEKVRQWICRAAEKLDKVRIVPLELTNNRRYGSKKITYGNICTIIRWGEWRAVKIHPMKHAIPNYGGIRLTGSQETPKFRT